MLAHFTHLCTRRIGYYFKIAIAITVPSNLPPELLGSPVADIYSGTHLSKSWVEIHDQDKISAADIDSDRFTLMVMRFVMLLQFD